jgi:multidrug resistance efflux pump
MPDQPGRRARLLATGVIVAATTLVAVWWFARHVRYPWTRSGQINAKIVLVTPQVSGEVTRVLVIDNQLVAAGDLLFEIDPRRFEHQVEQARVGLDEARQQVASLEAAVVVAEAAVSSAETGIETARGNIDAAGAQVEAARSLVSSAEAGVAQARASVARYRAELEQSERDRDRAVRLSEEGAGSVSRAESETAAAIAARASLDAAEASLLGAQANRDNADAGLSQAEANLIVTRNGLAEARARLASALADLEGARADLGVPGEENVRIRGAKASLADAELDLAWTRVHAPTDGYVTNLNLKIGDYATAGKPVLSHVDTGSFYVQGFFQETQLGHINPGDRALITPMSYRGETIEGTVESVGWAINPPGIAATGASGDGTLVPQVEPSFDWIRLAQRVPVRIRIDDVPDGVRLIAGTTVSVALRPGD